MRQAVWRRKPGTDNDHRDIGEWRGDRWYHFLAKGEKCLGHKGKGDWICHNYAGKDKKVHDKGEKEHKPRPPKKGIAPKTPVDPKVLEEYENRANRGHKITGEAMENLRRFKKRQEDNLKRAGSRIRKRKGRLKNLSDDTSGFRTLADKLKQAIEDND